MARYPVQMSETSTPCPPADEPRCNNTVVDAKWRALQNVASAVADMAGIGADAPETTVPDFPGMLAQTSGWRRNLAEDGLDDLIAIVEPGVGALLAVHARGHNTAPAATALWREIVLARANLLDLVASRYLPDAIANDQATAAYY
jgi:hypothetical protein